jgi:hypothetical protein
LTTATAIVDVGHDVDLTTIGWVVVTVSVAAMGHSKKEHCKWLPLLKQG